MARRFDISRPLDIPITPSFNSQELSIFVWFNLTSIPIYSTLFQSLRIEENPQSLGDSPQEFLIRLINSKTIDTNNSKLPYKLQSPFNIGQWYNIGFVYDNKNLYTYFNGTLLGSNTITLKSTIINSITIGKDFPGSLAELGIWDISLSQESIELLSKKYLPSKVCPDNLKYYRSFRAEDILNDSEHPSMVVHGSRNLTGAG